MNEQRIPIEASGLRSEPDKLVLSYAGLARRALTATAVVVAVVLVLMMIGYAAHVFLLAFAGVLIAVLLRGLADRLTAWTRLPSGWSLAVVVVALAGLLALTGWLIAPDLARSPIKWPPLFRERNGSWNSSCGSTIGAAA